MATEIDVGKVALRFRGVWVPVPVEPYESLDCVKDENQSSYVAVKDVPDNTPLTDAEYWYCQTDFSTVMQKERERQANEEARQQAEKEREEAADKVFELTVSAEKLPATAEASATISEIDGVKNIKFGIPQGKDGESGRDYVLTSQDKQEIADIAVKNLDITSVSSPYFIDLGEDGKLHLYRINTEE